MNMEPTYYLPGFVQREIDKLERELHKAPMDSTLYAQIYAAKQALHWAHDPNAAASPYAMLLDKRGDNSATIEMVELPGA
jgi:hypothetical protein